MTRVSTLELNLASRNVLVVAAHADDEVLGCGGTIAMHVARGDVVVVHILSVSDGSRSDEGQLGPESRRVSAHSAAAILGVSTLIVDNLPDNRFDSVSRLEIVQRIEQTVAAHRPTIMYTHSMSDLNADHCTTAEASITAARPYPGQSVEEILSFEVRSSTDWAEASGHSEGFNPNCWVTLSDDAVEHKLTALGAYNQEMRVFPHARSPQAISAQLVYRGSQVGWDAAEAFRTLRRIVPH